LQIEADEDLPPWHSLAFVPDFVPDRALRLDEEVGGRASIDLPDVCRAQD
jgi:hypothetical protein